MKLPHKLMLSSIAIIASVALVSPSLAVAEPADLPATAPTGQSIPSAPAETAGIELRAQGDAETGELDGAAVDSGSLGGSSGSLGSSSDSDGEEPPVPGVDSISARGTLELAQRSVTLTDQTAMVTVSTPTDTRAFESLFRLGESVAFAAPVEIDADPGAAAQGVTITHTFDEPIVEDEFYSIMFFNEDAGAWSAVDTTLSSDRRTLTATVDHLSLWSAIRSGAGAAADAVKVSWDAAGDGLRTVGEGVGRVLAKAPEVLYKVGSSVAGNYADAPTCTGTLPSWLATTKTTIDTPPHDYAAPVKFCAGSVSGDPERLEIKAVVNRTTPFFLEMPGQHIEVVGDASIGAAVGTALSVAKDPVSGLYKAWSDLGTRSLLPAQTATIRINKAAFDANGNSLRITARAFNPLAGGTFRVLSAAIGSATGDLSSQVALVVTGQCLGNLAVDTAKASGQLHSIVGPVANCITSSMPDALDALTGRNLLTNSAAETIKKRLALATIVAQLSQTVAETMMDYAAGARSRTMLMVAKGVYDDPADSDPSNDVAGPGVSLSGAQPIGSQSQFGRHTDFFDGRAAWVLTTGRMEHLDNPPGYSASTSLGNPGDADLSALSGGATFDAATYRVMVTPAAKYLHIEYAFATEEFPQYVNAGFNDVMAVYVNGRNCATVPGTDEPVAVDTVNDQKNSTWFASNLSGEVSPNLAFNSVTRNLKCSVPVTPGEPVEVLIAVADTGDHVLDSAVALVDGGIYSTD